MHLQSKLLLAPAALVAAGCASRQPALESWNDGPSKAAVVAFVETVTDEDGPGYVPPSERIAVFDNDGTLWAEQPAYFQLLFALDRVRALAPEHPEWRTTQPFQAVLEGDLATAAAGGEEALLELVVASHAGMSADEFDAIAREWLATARHPQTGRPYTDMVYRPMLELLELLRENGFKTFLVSGGGIDFLRAFAEERYGVPPEQVVGSSLAKEYGAGPAGPTIARLPELDFVDDKAGKPIGIHRHIGRRPILAFGNSDGDFQMLEYVTAGDGPRLGLLVHHDDAEREWAYDRDSHFGRLDRGLDEAEARGWVVVSMKDDWRSVFE